MYKGKDRKTIPLFEELFPFGGKLDENNRWLRVAELIPWNELEDEYRQHFSDIGRPATDARLFIGLILLKHMTGLSDREVVRSVQENVYHQAFCGYEHFVTDRSLDPSSLTKLRKRLGDNYFKELEEKTYRVLIDRRIIKGKGLLVDATIFPENIKYPNDVGLLNDVREWLVETIKPLGRRGKSPPDRWFKKKQRERNRIEGSFGYGKVHFGLDSIKYQEEDGSEMWVRLGIMGMNLQTALARM